MKIDCRKCKHFYVTWDKKFPYGCMAMGFKVSNLPSISVKKESGENCLMFSPIKKKITKKKKLYV